MDFTASTVVRAPLDAVHPVVADLSTYPRWFTIVRAVATDGDGAWLVDLGAKVGPFTRTKRVRMTRAGDTRFEREERDGRDHSAWILEATLTPATGDSTDVRMHVHYGGVPWVPGLDLILRNEARHAAGRLESLLAGRDPRG